MNTSAVNINATTIRYDQLPELTDLLIAYTGKREEVENFLGNVDADPFNEQTMQISGITVSLDAVKLGLQAELSAMELKLENRFNIIVGRPLPKVIANPPFETVDCTNMDGAVQARTGGGPAEEFVPYSALPEA